MTCCGARVLRGPDWDRGDEDGGEGHVGTIIELLSNRRVRVLWDTGEESMCRAGTDGKFDLRIFDTAQIGLRHPDTNCAECGEQNVDGMLWRCNDCTGYDICPLCYHGDKHDLRHQFLRFDTPGCAGILVKKRKSSVKLRTVGMFPGAKVTRGKHWMWMDQDGGPGSEGEVKGYENVVPDSSRNLVQVQWSEDGDINSYRLGFQGQVDLKCVEEEVGPLCYRDHLPVLDTMRTASGSSPLAATAQAFVSEFHSNDNTKIFSLSNFGKDQNTTNKARNEANNSVANYEDSSSFDVQAAAPQTSTMTTGANFDEDREDLAVGDRVAVAVGAEKLRQLQEDVGGCSDGMIKVVSEIGNVTGISTQMGATVKFEFYTYRFSLKALVKVHTFSEGDLVRIRPDQDQVKILNSKVGWKSNMSATIGKVGRVLKIDNEGDVLVGFGRHVFIFSPACCVPAPGISTDSLNLSTATSCSEEKTSAKVPERPPRDKAPSPVPREDVSSVYRVLRETMGFSSDRPGKHRLFHAVSQHDHHTVRRLCQADRLLMEIEHQKVTPLILACAEGHKRTVDVLLELGADVNHAIGPKRTPLCAALQGRNEDIVEDLLRHGADPFFVNTRLHTYLHIVAFNDLPRATRAIAACGVDVNAQDNEDHTALHIAIDKKRNKVVEALLQQPDIDLTVKDRQGFEILQWTAVRGNARAIELILEKDKSRVNVFHRGRAAPLHLAANFDHAECVRILILNGGADVNLQDSTGAGYSPLHQACICGKFRAAEALLELGADVHLKDASGDTPLHLSIGGREVDDLYSEAGRLETQQRIAIACMLISKGAYVDVENNSGRHPLTYGVHPVREGVKSFMEHNKHLVKRRGSVYSGNASKFSTLGISSRHGMGGRELSEALKGVGLPCGICGKAKSDVTLQPCQHKCVCGTCSDKVTKCPLCDVHVTDKIVTGPDEQTVNLNECKQM